MNKNICFEKQKMNILGISCYYHDSAASLVKNGKVVAAIEEERFSRKKFRVQVYFINFTESISIKI